MTSQIQPDSLVSSLTVITPAISNAVIDRKLCVPPSNYRLVRRPSSNCEITETFLPVRVCSFVFCFNPTLIQLLLESWRCTCLPNKTLQCRCDSSFIVLPSSHGGQSCRVAGQKTGRTGFSFMIFLSLHTHTHTHTLSLFLSGCQSMYSISANMHS